MPISKIIYSGTTLIDLTSDTVTAATLCSGITAHGADGSLLTGTLSIQTIYTGSSAPDASSGVNGDVYIQTGA